MADQFFRKQGEDTIYTGYTPETGFTGGLSSEQQAQQAGVIPDWEASWKPQGSTTNIQTITSDDIQNTKNIDLNNPDKDTSDNASPFVAGAVEFAKGLKEADDILKSQAEKDAEAKKTQFGDDILTGLTQLEEEGTEQLQKEEEAGIPDMSSQLADLSGQIGVKNSEFAVLQADYDKIEQELKNQPGTLQGHFLGQRAKAQENLRSKKNALAAEIGMLQAQGLAIQGKMTAAQNSVNRAIDLKYDSIEKSIETKKWQLGLIQDDLTEKEKERADYLNTYYNQFIQQQDEQKATEKANYTTLLSQMNQYPDAGIELTDTLEEANAKITANSAIYRQQTRLASTGTGDGGTGGGGGETPQIKSFNKELTSRVESLFKGDYGLTGGREQVIQRLQYWARINYPEIVDEISKMVYGTDGYEAIIPDGYERGVTIKGGSSGGLTNPFE